MTGGGAKTVVIAGRPVGPGRPCFVIAEAGSNHNGSLDQARRLIDVAAEAGADAVKFQLFRARTLYARGAGQTDYLKLPRSIYEIIGELEMPYAWLPRLAEHARERSIVFLASVFDEEAAGELDPFVEAFKVASYEMTHLPLVGHLARKGKPLIVSTGTASLDEVRETVHHVRESGDPGLALMQCTAAYPAPLGALNLRAITTMKTAFGIPVGLSDHSRDPLVAPMAAVALGADLLEKHFTLSNQLPGPDHPYAVEPRELKQMIDKVREVEDALGTGEKRVQPVEEELRRFARRAIYAARAIAPGEPFTRENLVVLRSGKLEVGLPPKAYESLLGRRATHAIAEEAPITAADCE